jgi:hypothetical protein
MSYTYGDVESLARQLLGVAGQFSIIESGEDKISANDALGMAVRALAEQAKVLQAMADEDTEVDGGE